MSGITVIDTGVPAQITYNGADKPLQLQPVALQDVQLKENGPSLQMRLESFHTFTHTQFSSVDTASKDGNFGQVTAANDQRRLQLAAKLTF